MLEKLTILWQYIVAELILQLDKLQFQSILPNNGLHLHTIISSPDYSCKCVKRLLSDHCNGLQAQTTHCSQNHQQKNMQDEMYKMTREKITALHKNTEALRSAIHCCNGRSSAHRCLTEGTVKSGLNLRVSQENIRICACQM